MQRVELSERLEGSMGSVGGEVRSRRLGTIKVERRAGTPQAVSFQNQLPFSQVTLIATLPQVARGTCELLLVESKVVAAPLWACLTANGSLVWWRTRGTAPGGRGVEATLERWCCKEQAAMTEWRGVRQE